MRTLRDQDNEFVSESLDHVERGRAIQRAERHRRWYLVAALILGLLIATIRVVAGTWDPITLVGMLALLGLAVSARQETSEIRLLKLVGALREPVTSHGSA